MKFWKKLDNHIQTRQRENNQLYTDGIELTPAMKKEARITGFYGLLFGLICGYLVYYFQQQGRHFIVYLLSGLMALICIPFGIYQTVMGRPLGRK